MQKYANLVELEKCCQTHIFLQNFVLIQPRTSPPKICKKIAKFANFADPNPLTPTERRRDHCAGRGVAVAEGEGQEGGESSPSRGHPGDRGGAYDYTMIFCLHRLKLLGVLA